MRILLTLVLCSMIACGSGNDTNNTPIIVKKPITDTSLRDGSYAYNMKTESVDMVCSDGSKTVNEKISFNAELTILNHTSTLKSIDKSSTSKDELAVLDFQILKSSGYEGTYSLDGSLNITSTVSAYHKTFGNMYIQYNISGMAYTDRWFGIYKYTITFISFNVVCKYSTTFTGKKL